MEKTLREELACKFCDWSGIDGYCDYEVETNAPGCQEPLERADYIFSHLSQRIKAKALTDEQM